MKTLSAAIAALCLLLTPAKSTTVTDTFTGVVVGSDNLGNVTTTDFNNNFGGGNLIGQTFTVTMSVDTSIVSPGTNFVTGGTFYSYFAPNPISSTITINGYTLSLNDSSDGYKFDQGNGTVDAYLQAFVYNSGQQLQTYGIALELFTNVQATPDLTVMLPSMLLANGDYTNYFATFYDNSALFSQGPESLTLEIDAVNQVSSVPGPVVGAGLPGLLLLATNGLLCLARRRRRN